MLNNINSSIKGIKETVAWVVIGATLATSVLVTDILNKNIEGTLIDLEPETNSYLYKKYNELVNDFIELDKKMKDLENSIQLDSTFDSDTKKEFISLFMHKVIDNFDWNNTEENINSIMEQLNILLNEISNKSHNNIDQWNIKNGQMSLDNQDIKFKIDNQNHTIQFDIEKSNRQFTYTFSEISKPENIWALESIDWQSNINSDKKNQEKESKNNFYSLLLNDDYLPEKKFDDTISDTTTSIINSHTIIHDNWSDYIQIKYWDTIFSIKNFLSKNSNYLYLQDKKYNTRRDESFNIESNMLQINMMLPIPLDIEKKSLSTEDFIYYVYQGLNEMKTDPKYWKKIQELLTVMSEKDILSLATWVAKQESHLGQKSLHRYEKWKKIFSQWYYHLLMDSFWKKILDNLWLTEWSLSNPKYWTKAFLAFIIEKYWSNELSKYFPLDTADKINMFAKKYNGIYWLEHNSNYIKHLIKYTKEIDDILWNDKKTLFTYLKPNINITEESSIEEIKNLQLKLQLIWYFPHDIEPNGRFGSETKKAIQNFRNISV